MRIATPARHSTMIVRLLLLYTRHSLPQFDRMPKLKHANILRLFCLSFQRDAEQQPKRNALFFSLPRTHIHSAYYYFMSNDMHAKITGDEMEKNCKQNVSTTIMETKPSPTNMKDIRRMEQQQQRTKITWKHLIKQQNGPKPKILPFFPPLFDWNIQV